jgi:NADH-quinone oxidoreductase subunit L
MYELRLALPYQGLLTAIPALPLAAAVFITLFGPRLLRGRSHLPCILALAVSFVLAVLVFLFIHANAYEPGKAPGTPVSLETSYTWFQVKADAGEPGVNVGFTLRADALSATMLVMITFIGLLITIFSTGYMEGDPGYPRFFACMALFIFSMTLLVLADNLVLLFFGWEGVGLCSYLLIGFWFEKPSAAAAARKAFLVTRIGDVGMLVGVLLLWVSSGYKLNYAEVFGWAQGQPEGGVVVTTAALLLFCGAAGKSAQFPLHVWLPDAMEGPTPVSALIHAATMVTAGVYLVARCTPIFVMAPVAQATVAVLGATTALLAAFIALTQTDLKRVLAYSTLSQLGYMFLALGCGLRGSGLVTFAVVAAMFHLFTHAFFKALLFLSAGSVMHAMGHVIDMRRFSGLRRVMPLTHIGFLCGAVALAGIPFLSGFWSKDEILAAASNAGTHGPKYQALYLTLFGVGVLVAGLTAFYTFRAYFLTFWGPLRIPEEAHAHHGPATEEAGHGHGHDDHHAHTETTAGGTVAEPRASYESAPSMTVPLLVLSVFALGVGAALGPTHLFAHFVENTPGLPAATAHEANLMLMTVSGLLGLGGVGVAWLMYVKQPSLPAKLAGALQGLYQLSWNKLYIDDLYYAFLVAPLEWLATAAGAVDYYFVDSLVDLIGNVPRLIGYLFRPVQNGLVQFYALAMVLGLTVFLLTLVRAL